MNVTLWVDGHSVLPLNSGEDKLDDVLVMSIERGPLTFLTIKGEWLLSSVGSSLDLLCRIVKPIREYDHGEVKELIRAGSTKGVDTRNGHSAPPPVVVVRSSRIDASEGLTPDPPAASPKSHIYSIPKEIWQLVDFIYRFGLLDSEALFTSAGDPQTKAYFRECLDCGIEFDLCLLLEEKEEETRVNMKEVTNGVKDLGTGESPTSTNTRKETQKPRRLGRLSSLSSACSTLLCYLAALPEPVIPFALYRRCIQDGSQSLVAAKQVLKLAPPLHYNLFVYLVSFLKEIIGARGGVAGHSLHLGMCTYLS